MNSVGRRGQRKVCSFFQKEASIQGAGTEEQGCLSRIQHGELWQAQSKGSVYLHRLKSKEEEYRRMVSVGAEPRLIKDSEPSTTPG